MGAGIKVAPTGDIPEGEAISIFRSVCGTEDNIAVLHDTDGTFWALNDTCTHAEASLAEGWVEDGCVGCLIHFSKFDLKTGEASGQPAPKRAVCHRLEVRGDEIGLFPNEKPADGFKYPAGSHHREKGQCTHHSFWAS